MPDMVSPALTPEQWDAKDYRQSARALDGWADAQSGTGQEDTTEYVAKLGLSESGSVVAMNRAHDRVLIPPPARAALAALALVEQPFGFTPADVEAVLEAAKHAEGERAAVLHSLGQRIEALMPPAA